MKYLSEMIWVEARKALRSRMPLFTAIGSLAMPLGIAFLIFVARNPEIGRQLGLIGAKANLMTYATTDWPSYLGLQAQIIAAGGFFVFCLIICWVFGREFTDGTLKDMLAVPVPRMTIVAAKFVVTAVWSAVIAVLIFVVGLLTGALVGLPQASAAVMLQGSLTMAVTVCLVVAVVTPFAFFASVGRGYLLPIGLAVLALMLANLVMVLGWGEFFPWAVPGLYAQGNGSLGPASCPIAILTGLAGMAGTYLWWKYADQSH